MVVIAILGLLVPGYLLARALRSPAAWAIAFPLSALLIAVIVISYTLLGIPIRFGNVLTAVLIATGICLAMIFRRQGHTDRFPEIADVRTPPRRFMALVAILVGALLLIVLVRSILTPLSGPDTVLRWDALPRLMLQYESLSYYPPLTSDDFAKYFVPDGFPPLVASVYWWLYAGWGSAFPRITSVAIWLQAVSCFALVYYAARIQFGTTGGLLAIAILASSAFFFQGVMIGQENGFIALSYAGQLLFAFAAVRQPKANLVVIAALFAGLGALVREYGPLLSICGFAVLACNRETRRYLPLFVVVSAAIGAPWYFRNWVLTGNPIYSLDTGLGLPVNPVLGGIRAVYHEFQGPANGTVTAWLGVAKYLLLGAPLALLIGVPGIAAAGKERIGLGVSALLAFVLWYWSIANTSGGIAYTWRFLAPAWIVLSISAGAFGPALLRAIEGRRLYVLTVSSLALAICCGYSIVCSWSESFEPDKFSFAVTGMREDPLEFYTVQLWIAKTLEGSNLPAVGVLTEDCNLAVALQRYTRFRPVMIWSPEVQFVFNPAQEASIVRRQLIDKKIWLVAVTYLSLNNNYLIKFPFYAELFQNLKPIVAVPESQSIIFLPKLVQPDFETVTPGK